MAGQDLSVRVSSAGAPDRPRRPYGQRAGRSGLLPQNEAYRAYDRFESRGSADELSKLADLRDRGVITDAEFQKGKPQLLG